MKRVCLLTALLLAMASLLVACGGDDKKQQAQSASPTPVTVVQVESRDVPVHMEWSGQVLAKDAVDVRARVEGYLKERDFKEGSLVEKGQLLFVIDPQPFKEDLSQAQANLESAQAQLAKANADLKRYKELIEQEVISRSQFDSVKTDQATLVAKVKQLKAAVETAKINLGYTRIEAPISGQIGQAYYDVGALVGPPSDSLLAKVFSKDSVYVKFALSEKQYLKFVRRGVDKSVEQETGKRDVQLILSDGSVYDHSGELNMAEPELDPKTGTLGIRLEFPNPDGLLIPGQFAKVRARVRTESGVPVIPRRVVVDVQGSRSVLTVQDGKIVSKGVKLGATDNKLVAVESGISAGDKVIVDNIQKLRPGMPVKPQVISYDKALGEGGAGADSGKKAAAGDDGGEE